MAFDRPGYSLAIALAVFSLSACQTIAHPTISRNYVFDRTASHAGHQIVATRTFRDRYGRVLFPTSDGRAFTSEQARREYLYSLSRRSTPRSDYVRSSSHRHRADHHKEKSRGKHYTSPRGYKDLRRAEEHVRRLRHDRDEAVYSVKRRQKYNAPAYREQVRLREAEYELYEAERHLARLKGVTHHRAEPRGYRYYKDHGHHRDAPKRDRANKHRYDHRDVDDHHAKSKRDRRRKKSSDQAKVQAKQHVSRDRKHQSQRLQDEDYYRKRYQDIRENNRKFRDRLADAKERSRQTGRPVDEFLRSGLRDRAKGDGK
ncbi:MAG: hypothetical protein AAF501_04950 [Pseudomonadota bacterium]